MTISHPRALLAAAVLLAVPLAGCAGGPGGDDSEFLPEAPPGSSSGQDDVPQAEACGTDSVEGVEGPDTWPSSRLAPSRNAASGSGGDGDGCVIWNASLPEAESGYGAKSPKPVVADETVYVRRGGALTAFSLEDGTEKWQETLDVERPALLRPPVVGEENIYLKGLRGTLLALDADDGSEVWRNEDTDAVRGPMALEGDSLFSATGDVRYLSEFATSNGSERYFVQTDTELFEPVAVGDHVYAGSIEGLVAVDVEERSVAWSDGRINRFAVHDGTVYGSHGPPGNDTVTLRALDAEDGSEVWNASSEDWTLVQPVVADGNLYIGDVAALQNPALISVDASDGTERWRTEVDKHPSYPVVADGTMYVATQKAAVHALDPEDGSKTWSVKLANFVGVSDPIVADGTLVVATAEPALYVLDVGAVG
jgi:outer membrane protein assembly factor BamB